MTRDEAIENLKEFIDTYITCHGEEDTVAVSIDNVDVEALDMAIEALKQLTSYEQTINKLTKAISEQEPFDDAKSRQAVMDCFKKWQPYMATRLWDFEQELSKLPLITPQPETGYWITLKDEYGDVCEAVCSFCDNNGNHKWNYCPNCGRRMIEPQESEG